MSWPREQIQNCWVDELQVFPFFFAQHFLISPFIFQSHGGLVFLHRTSNRTFDSVLPENTKIHLWIGRLRVKPGGNNKHPLPRAGHCKICSCERGWRAVGSLSPSSDQLWRGSCPVCPQRTRVAAHIPLFCHSWGIRKRAPGVLSSWITLMMNPPAPFLGFAYFLIKVVSTGLNKQWFWFLFDGSDCCGSQAGRVWVENLRKMIIREKYFYLKRRLWPIILIVEIRIVLTLLNLLSWNFSFWKNFSFDKKTPSLAVLQCLP